jgi:hypothetical protein
MYQNSTYVISYFENLANLNCKFHTTKTLLNSTIISSHPSNMGPSKKCKTSTATKAVVNKDHNGRTDIDVNGSIAAGVHVSEAAAIGGANAAGNPTIEVVIANTTNMAAASKAIAAIAAIAATAAAAGNAIAATTAAAINAITDTAAATYDAIAATAYATDDAVEATMATIGNTAYKACTANAAAIADAHAASNFTIEVNISNTTDTAATVNSITATADAAGNGVKVTSGMITTKIADFKDTDVSSLVRVNIHTCRALLYIESLLLSHYKNILNFNNFTHIS